MAKGGRFENKIIDLVTAKFADFGITPQDASRSRGSGASKKAFGDVTISPALAKIYPFATECKNYARIDLHQLMVPGLKGKTNQFGQWWKQTLEGVAKSLNYDGYGNKLFPLLVFRSKGLPVMCMLYSKDMWSMFPLKQNYFRKKQFSIISAHHKSGELLCFKFDILLRLLYRKQKKGLHNGQVHSNKGSGVRLRTQNTVTSKQVQKSTRASGKVTSKRIRSTTVRRKQHRNGTGLRRTKKRSNGAA